MSQQQHLQDSLLSDSSPAMHENMIFNLFAKVGTQGIYQKVTLIFWCTSLYLCGGVTLIIPFLFYEDPYQCPQSYSDMTCTQYVCRLPLEQRDSFIPAKSIETMANKFGNYRCEDDATTLDVVVMLIYSSTAVSYLLLSLFGDYLGRKKFIIFGLGLTIGGLILTVLATNLVLGTIGMFISCLGTLWIFSLSQLYISETVSQSLRDQFIVISQFSYGIGHLINAGYYYWLRDWQLVFIYFYIIPSILTTIGVAFLVVDSPICLIRKLQPKEVKTALLWVAKINRIKQPIITQEEISEVKQKERIREKEQEKGSKFTVIDLFRYPSLRMKTVYLSILQALILFIFYAPTLMIAQFQFDLYINGLVIGVSSLLAYPFCYFSIAKFKRKTMALTCFSVILICSFIMIFFWHPRSDQVAQPIAENIGVLVAFFIIGFAITIEYSYYEVYLLELFPTQVRLIGSSFATMLGGIWISFSDIIIDSCNRGGFSIMYVFCMFAAVAIFTSLKLPETFDLSTPDILQEFSEKASLILETDQTKEQTQTIPGLLDAKSGKFNAHETHEH